MATIAAGVEFDTPFEQGCIALTTPDQYGQFVGLDSDGVECSFHTKMVVEPAPPMQLEAAGFIRDGEVQWTVYPRQGGDSG